MTCSRSRQPPRSGSLAAGCATAGATAGRLSGDWQAYPALSPRSIAASDTESVCGGEWDRVGIRDRLRAAHLVGLLKPGGPRERDRCHRPSATTIVFWTGLRVEVVSGACAHVHERRRPHRADNPLPLHREPVEVALRRQYLGAAEDDFDLAIRPDLDLARRTDLRVRYTCAPMCQLSALPMASAWRSAAAERRTPEDADHDGVTWRKARLRLCLRGTTHLPYSLRLPHGGRPAGGAARACWVPASG